MSINKVIFGDTTLIDLTQSTLSSASQIINGTTAYDRAGNLLTGTATAGNEWTSGIYKDAQNYIRISPLSAAGGVKQSGGYIILDQTQAGTGNLGTKNITINGTYNAASDSLDGYSSVVVDVAGGSAVLGTKTIVSNGTYTASADSLDGYSAVTVTVPSSTPNLQVKTGVVPTESSQTITADSNYDGLSSVQINAISSTYVGTGIAQRSSANLTASGAVVSVPSGYYAVAASKTIDSGVAGTPVATKGTVSNHTINITPSVTNTAGYITGGTTTGTAVSITASELVSGTKSIVANGSNIDVINYATVNVEVPTSSVNNQDKAVIPSESEQVVSADSGYTGLGNVTVAAISSSYVGSNIPRKTEANLYINGPTVAVPSGYYAANASATVLSGTAGTPVVTKGTPSRGIMSVTASVTNTTGYIEGGTLSSVGVLVLASELDEGTITITSSGTIDVVGYASASVASGSATTPATTITANPTISVNASGLITATATASQNVTPSITSGFVTSGTSGKITVSGSSTSQLSTQAATTITPTKSSQTAVAAGKYTTGAITVAAIPSNYIDTTDATASASDILSTKTAYVNGSKLTGSLVIQHYYTGTTTPASSLGSNGDIYLKTS